MAFDFSLMASDGNRSSSSNSNQIGFSELSTPLAIRRDYLMVAQMVDLSKVMEFLAIEENQARVLLMHHRWNIERVFDALDRKGKEKLFAEAGVPFLKDEVVGFNLNQLPMQCEGDRFVCTVCFEEVDVKEVTGLECGHYFCNRCWTEHFIASIDNGTARRIRCMAIQCSSVCNYQTVRLLVSARDLLKTAQFDHLLLESYIDDNYRACWCPSNPPCDRAIRIGSHSDRFCEIECVCGTQFCFNCLSEAHSPCTCQIWGMWVKRCNFERQNSGRIGDLEQSSSSEGASFHTAEDLSHSDLWVNIRVCPGCGNGVVKASGCNHMTCRCGQTFCWLCGGATGISRSLEGHTCNHFMKSVKSEQAKPSETELERQGFMKSEQTKPTETELKRRGSTGNDLCRFMHYYERYRSHTDSLQKETVLRQSLQSCCLSFNLSIDPTDRPTRDGNWFLTGFEMLLLSRRVLTYTYPLAFYIFGDELAGNDLKNKEIRQYLFEDQQGQLEFCVEKLAMELQRDFNLVAPSEVADMRLRVISLTRLLDSCCRKMYECIQEELLPYLGLTEFIAQYKTCGPDKAKEMSCVERF